MLQSNKKAMEKKVMKVDKAELLNLLGMFTTSTELLRHWNDDKPEWMRGPYICKDMIYATNGAICITIDPKKIDFGALVLPVYDKKPSIRNILNKEKRWYLFEGWVRCIADISDEPYNIHIGEAVFYEEFWRPIKAAYYFFDAKKMTVITKTEKDDVFGVELIDGVRCYIMPVVYRD